MGWRYQKEGKLKYTDLGFACPMLGNMNKYSPKWWRKMVIFHNTIRKKNLLNTNPKWSSGQILKKNTNLDFPENLGGVPFQKSIKKATFLEFSGPDPFLTSEVVVFFQNGPEPPYYHCGLGAHGEASKLNIYQIQKGGTLQGINISHLGKRKIIFKMAFLGDYPIIYRVFVPSQVVVWDFWTINSIKSQNGGNRWQSLIDSDQIFIFHQARFPLK